MSDTITLGLNMREHTHCTKEEKLGCLPLIDEMVGFAELARMEGLLAFEKMANEHENVLFRAGIGFAVDGVDKISIAYYMTDMIVMSHKTGVELLKQYIITTGILDIMNGDHPRLVRRHLTMLLGDEVYGEVMKPETKETGSIDTTNYPASCEAGEETNSILDNIKEKEYELYQKIREKTFVFEDIACLNNRDIQRIIRDTHNSEIAVALKMCSDSLRRAIFSNMSAEHKKMIVEDMEIMGPVRERDAKEAQQRIAAVVEKLAGTCKILRR